MKTLITIAAALLFLGCNPTNKRQSKTSLATGNTEAFYECACTMSECKRTEAAAGTVSHRKGDVLKYVPAAFVEGDKASYGSGYDCKLKGGTATASSNQVLRQTPTREPQPVVVPDSPSQALQLCSSHHQKFLSSKLSYRNFMYAQKLPCRLGTTLTRDTGTPWSNMNDQQRIQYRDDLFEAPPQHTSKPDVYACVCTISEGCGTPDYPHYFGTGRLMDDYDAIMFVEPRNQHPRYGFCQKM